MTAPSRKSPPPANIYRAARLSKNITLVKASDDTHIRRAVLQAIEQDKADHLPAVYVAGLKQSYARYLGLEPAHSAPSPRKSSSVSPHRRTKEPLRSRPVITSALSLRLAAIGIILLVVGYAGLQIYRFFAAPLLTVDRPDKSELLATDSALEISGKTSPEINIFVGQQSVPLQPDGRFQTWVTLRSGINDIEVRAVNTLGKVATHHITAVFLPRVILTSWYKN